MKPNKEKIKEPLRPEQTPEPPQIIDPTSEKEITQKKTPAGGKRKEKVRKGS